MASDIVAKLVVFSILFNLAAGFVFVAVIDSDGNKVFDNAATGGLVYDEDQTNVAEFQTELEKSIQPAGSLDDKGDQIYRVLDMMSLGFIYRFFEVVDTYMFGFVNILDSTLGQYIDDEARVILFGNENNDDLIPNKLGIFKILISLGYIFMGIQLFTGKDVVEGR
jgi:hypothetical protein